MRILVGCEASGVVRDALRKRGHDAWSCDLRRSDSPHHIHGDVRNHLKEGWDGAIFHPPCTRLCNSGVRWLEEYDLWDEFYDAARFFNELKDCDIPRIAVENPIPHKYAIAAIGRYDQTVQPWQFGTIESKRTCFWLKGLPELIETKNVEHLLITRPKEVTDRVHHARPGAERWMERSDFDPNMAKAIARQWFLN